MHRQPCWRYSRTTGSTAARPASSEKGAPGRSSSASSAAASSTGGSVRKFRSTFSMNTQSSAMLMPRLAGVWIASSTSSGGSTTSVT